MTDAECVKLLRWALPRLGLRWEGHRKVRGQVCKRIARRARALGLDGAAAYREYLEEHPGEWQELEPLCRVTISRFYRDRGVFQLLGAEILPELARAAVECGRRRVRAWSAGCGAGEEPYTLSIVWSREVSPSFPEVELRIVATDADAHQLERARRACYPAGTLRELPDGWREAAFVCGERSCCLRAELRERVDFSVEDVRLRQPDGPFDLVLCRNLVFTYFDEDWQRRLLARIGERLEPRGFLVLGRHETLPSAPAFEEVGPGRRIYRFRG